MIDAVQFSNIKIAKFIDFMPLPSKLTSELCQKLGSLDEKTKQNRLNSPTLPSFSQKTAVFIAKR